ncbi:uncharacterized protein LOC109057331 [Cyprinus carpio]|uniref:Uncharacterized protein LOC109057331 n=1 Tax=Cyprinus carpio TaxID=7962 RepID=A0A9Q9W1I1_CYPCA|nr:uncharacterized protein LOC109057331 [Cyprinus carpio]
MSWSQAQSYCQQTYTDLVFVYSEEDLVKLEASRPLLAYGYAWIGGYDMKSDYSDSQNITESDNTTTHSTSSDCLALNIFSWKRVKKDCEMPFSFYCSRNEGKRVVLRMQVKPGGQVNTQDPVIRVKMLAKINDKLNKLGLGDAIKIRWLTRREKQRKNSDNNTCTLDTPSKDPPPDKRIFTTTHTPSCVFQDVDERPFPITIIPGPDLNGKHLGGPAYNLQFPKIDHSMARLAPED